MSLYTDIKILTTANGYKVDKLYSVKPTNGDGDFTAIRNTTATYENSSGAIVSAATDVPRLDYSDGSCPTVLLEPASSNIFSNSGFSGAVSGTPGTPPTYWDFNKSGGSLTVETSKYSAGNKLKFSTSNARHIVKESIYLNASTTYLCSMLVNSDLAIALREILYTSSPSGATIVWYINGVESNFSTNIPTGDSVISMKITTVSSGYSQVFFGIGIYGNSFTANITFDLPQLEPLPYRTSYIPTVTTSLVSRALDSIIDSGTSADFNSVSGTLYLKAKALVSSGTDRVLSANDGTAANSASIVYDSVANTVNGVYTKAGVVIATCTAVITDVTATNKIAFTYEGSSFKLYVNGSLEHTISSGSVTASNVFNSLDSNQGDNTLHLEAKVYEIQSYSKVLTLLEVASL